MKRHRIIRTRNVDHDEYCKYYLLVFKRLLYLERARPGPTQAGRLRSNSNGPARDERETTTIITTTMIKHMCNNRYDVKTRLRFVTVD